MAPRQLVAADAQQLGGRCAASPPLRCSASVDADARSTSTLRLRQQLGQRAAGRRCRPARDRRLQASAPPARSAAERDMRWIVKPMHSWSPSVSSAAEISTCDGRRRRARTHDSMRRAPCRARRTCQQRGTAAGRCGRASPCSGWPRTCVFARRRAPGRGRPGWRSGCAPLESVTTTPSRVPSTSRASVRFRSLDDAGARRSRARAPAGACASSARKGVAATLVVGDLA